VSFLDRVYKYCLLTWCGRYYEGGVSSVYLWDLDHGFAGVVLMKKAGDGSNKIKGCWDSIHVIEVQVSLLTCPCLMSISVSFSQLFIFF